MAKLEVVKKEENDFVVKVLGRQELVRIEDTFAEMFPFVATSPAIRNLTSDFYFPHLINGQTRLKNHMEDNSRSLQ